MRIFIAVRHALDPRQFYGALWSSNFDPALRALGHELVDLFLSYFYNSPCDPEGFDQLRKAGVPVEIYGPGWGTAGAEELFTKVGLPPAR